jgi:outer membrane protein TolC
VPVLEPSSAVVLAVLIVQAAAGPRGLERLTLEQALARAMARNPNVLVAAAEVRRAEALVMEARASALPTLLPSGTYTRIDAARRFMDMTALAATQWGATAPLAVPLIAPLPWAQWAHAIDDRHVAEMGSWQTWRQVAIAVANAYLTVITTQRTLEVAKVSRNNAAAHAEYTRKQNVAGSVSELDLVRAEQQLRLTQGQLEQAAIALARAREALGVLVAGDRPVDAAEPTNFPMPSPRDTPTQRADIRYLELRRKAAHNQVKDSYADYLPYLSGVFSPIYTEPPTFIQPRWGWQLQLTLTVPIFDGGFREGRRLAQRALLDEATFNLEGELRTANADIRLGYEAVARADARLRDLEASATLARRALEISTLRYQQGATTNIEVIDAEQQSRQSDLSAALAADDAQSTRLNLLAATGAFPPPPP